MSRVHGSARLLLAPVVGVVCVMMAGGADLLAYVVPQEPLIDGVSTGGLGLGGTWSAEVAVAPDRTVTGVRLNLRRRGRSSEVQHTLSLGLAELRGLGAEQAASGAADVQFRIPRDAGAIHFEGRFQAREGSGHFTFVPNAEYLAAMRIFGHRGIDAEQAFTLAALDVSRTFVQDLFVLGYYRVTLEELQTLRVLGADASFVRAMAALGHPALTVDQLKAARTQGVTPEFISELKDAGQTGLALNELLSFRIHGVSSLFVRDLRAMGYERLTAERVVAMKIHGVTPEFVRELRAMGYRSMAADDLVRFRIHGVTPAFIRRVNEGAGRPTSVDRLLALRIGDQRLPR